VCVFFFFKKKKKTYLSGSMLTPFSMSLAL
jgi:hypothetical protein